MIGTIHLFFTKALLRPILLLDTRPTFYLGLFLREILTFIFKCDISPLADVPFSTRFPHYIGIAIGTCTLGEKCIIRPNVIIGRKDLEGPRESLKEKKAKGPVIGNGVIIGANSCVIGPVQIGSYSIIGAGSVVIHDVEPYSVYAGVPARKIKDISPSQIHPTSS